jgi:hypothetical protein
MYIGIKPEAGKIMPLGPQDFDGIQRTVTAAYVDEDIHS